MRKDNNEVLITHVFDAERELVFRAWTEPEQLCEWFAPDGCTINFKSIHIEEGGTFHSCVHNPEYGNCWCKGMYLEIIYPEKIVFTMQVTDEHGDDIAPADAGMSADWPASTTVTITLIEMDGKTKLTLNQTVSEALAKYTGAYPSWLQMFQKLNKIL